MERTDETVVESLNEYKKGTYGDLENGFYIREEYFKFDRYQFFEDKMSVMLPEKFIDLPEMIVKMKYPSEQRPKVIKTNQEGGINFTFNIVDEVSLMETDVKYIADSMRNGIKSINPAVVMGEDGTLDVAGTKLCWFEFQSNAFDGTMYNLMYCLPIHGKLMHGVFNCFMQDKEAWKPVALEVMSSVIDETHLA